ncbi:MAG: 6-bladed beta-propeller [Candidatus Zhuqueibacterota bacterium]
MKKIYLFAAMILLIFSSSCGKKVGTATVEVVDGVKFVHCTDQPLHPKRTVEFIEELTISGEDDAGNVILYQPGAYTIDSDENIYISDRSENVIKVFDRDGQLLKTIGGKGSGPGEFQSIGRMMFLPDKRLIVMDFQLRRTSFFDTSWNFSTSVQWRNAHFDAYFVTDSTYTIDENIFGEERELFVKTYDFAHNERLSYGKFTPYGMKMHRQGDMAFAITDPFKPRSVLTGDLTNHLLYHCLNDKYLIEVYGADGKVCCKIDRPYQPMPFTETDKEEYISQFADNDNPVFQEMAKGMEFPALKTVVERMFVDDEGRLWVVTNEEKEQDGATFTAYDIFNKDGFYDARVWLDVTPGGFVNGKMYSIHTDKDTDLRSLKRYNVVWKG